MSQNFFKQLKVKIIYRYFHFASIFLNETHAGYLRNRRLSKLIWALNQGQKYSFFVLKEACLVGKTSMGTIFFVRSSGSVFSTSIFLNWIWYSYFERYTENVKKTSIRAKSVSKFDMNNDARWSCIHVFFSIVRFLFFCTH